MIHILHTADLHLGKVIYEHSLIEDQKKVLALLKDILRKANAAKDPYSALVISGDIYDRSIPNPEAISLFDSFLTEVKKENPELALFLHPGNHDSAARLSYASELLKNQNIHIATKFSDSLKATLLKKGEERLAVFQIPFLTAGFLHGQEGSEKRRSQEEMLSFVIEKIQEEKEALEIKEGLEKNSLPSLLSAHLFTLGGSESDSERTIVGTAEYVNANLFSPFTYTALGHLHKSQKVFENDSASVYYSGAPIAYSFGEGDKSFLSVSIDTEKNKIASIKKIPIEPLRKMTQLEGSFSDFFSKDRFDAHREEYLEIKLKDANLIENPMQLLRSKFPYLLSINQSYALSKQEGSSLLTERKEVLEKKNSFADILNLFIKDVDTSLDKNEVEKLLSLAMSIEKEKQEKEIQ